MQDELAWVIESFLSSKLITSIATRQPREHSVQPTHLSFARVPKRNPDRYCLAKPSFVTGVFGGQDAHEAFADRFRQREGFGLAVNFDGFARSVDNQAAILTVFEVATELPYDPRFQLAVDVLRELSNYLLAGQVVILFRKCLLRRSRTFNRARSTSTLPFSGCVGIWYRLGQNRRVTGLLARRP